MHKKLTISRFILLLIVLAVVYYGKRHPQKNPTQQPTATQTASASDAANGDLPANAKSTSTAPLTANSANEKIIVNSANGSENISASLQRIRAGKRLHQFRDDGIVFENRESRLPQKASGYYNEYVHPTAGEYGPGAQRIVTGANGEVYYTPDHYRTFQRVQILEIP